MREVISGSSSENEGFPEHDFCEEQLFNDQTAALVATFEDSLTGGMKVKLAETNGVSEVLYKGSR
jgi:hypothetical protein